MDERVIFLMRHAQTQLSTGKRLIGQCDVELSEQGEALCRHIGPTLKQYGFTHVFSSGLKRAKHTAHILCSYVDKDVQVIDTLSEISLGEWDGRFVDDIRHEYPEAYARRGRDMIYFRPPGGENFADLKERVTPAFHSILRFEGNLLIVAHSSVNRVILADVLGMPLERIMSISQDYGACHVLVQSGGDIYVRTLNSNINIGRC